MTTTNATTSAGSVAGRPITSVLVANRGEIARRVFATCRRRGIATVAVYSDADADSPHVTEADASVQLPGTAPAETYLRGDLVIAAALRAGADAIHPGYGFLSENADFAAAVQEAGLTWIGPDPKAIRLMGSKVESKQLMADAGVPVLDRLDPDDITEADLPVLVKASAGGGGRGMRIVRTPAEVLDAVASAAREAASAFGDPTVFCERYLESGHHVEVQVMADAHGTVWALGERECSLQRRHQKVIEEAPSPLVEHVGADMRERLLAAARNAATAVDYRSAGTVEFLADDTGRFWFLEMNTRLQVEHPVTESVTGLDLVGLQLDVAAGLALQGDEPTMTGHSIEARLYAEDPARDWQPQSGTVHVLDVPGVTTQFAIPEHHGIRLDAGVREGTVVGVSYDPMLAKVISRAPTRHEAARELASALRRARIHGLTTNRDLLVASLLHPDYLSGTADTRFYTQHDPAELASSIGLDPALGALVAALADASAQRANSPVLQGIPSGFRNVPGGFQRRSYTIRADELPVAYRIIRRGLELERLPDGVGTIGLLAAAPDRVVLDLDGVRRQYTVARFTSGDVTSVVVDGAEGSITLHAVPRFVDPSTQVQAGALVAPMPGTIVRVAVVQGSHVEPGQPLLWLEAMKMEHAVTATTAGVVNHVHVVLGQQVDQATTLAVVDDAPTETDQDETMEDTTP
ncbi:MAG: biotin/lipoyl-binding protein [Intrasporangium sp.]|uniref:acetyl/propionyl/methylcrotonyl-CoA carboxylase subunit alpha n=1 Tax=Intrasporangium sp. TaxID=1925024 RepID=UPI00264747FE|nr:biotin carboxylase N-terminal domain-containing protein [Intrasporangium sp.]MDN5794766.1 biotin/lipoyl-binding protein [Intrasporangium sp.]